MQGRAAPTPTLEQGQGGGAEMTPPGSVSITFPHAHWSVGQVWILFPLWVQHTNRGERSHGVFGGNLNIDWQCRDIKELRVDSFLGVFMVVLWLCLEEFFHIQKSLQKFVRVSKGRGESKTGT